VTYPGSAGVPLTYPGSAGVPLTYPGSAGVPLTYPGSAGVPPVPGHLLACARDGRRRASPAGRATRAPVDVGTGGTPALPELVA